MRSIKWGAFVLGGLVAGLALMGCSYLASRFIAHNLYHVMIIFPGQILGWKYSSELLIGYFMVWFYSAACLRFRSFSRATLGTGIFVWIMCFGINWLREIMRMPRVYLGASSLSISIGFGHHTILLFGLVGCLAGALVIGLLFGRKMFNRKSSGKGMQLESSLILQGGIIGGILIILINRIVYHFVGILKEGPLEGTPGMFAGFGFVGEIVLGICISWLNLSQKTLAKVRFRSSVLFGFLAWLGFYVFAFLGYESTGGPELDFYAKLLLPCGLVSCIVAAMGIRWSLRPNK